jgi:hypothetical protein
VKGGKNGEYKLRKIWYRKLMERKINQEKLGIEN